MEKFTLITGSANGLGKEFAKLYAKEGCNLLLIDFDEKALIETSKEIKNLYKNIVVETLISDLSKKEELHKIEEYVSNNDYFVNNLINCAGFGEQKDFIDMNEDFQLKMSDVDCNTLLYLTNVFVKEMVKQNEGHIINISSLAGFMPGPYMCTYHACKSFVLSLGEAISYELRKTKVKLLTLCPGPFMSKFVEKAHNDYTFKKIKPISAEKVAEFGYKKSKKGKSLAIVGLKNRVLVFLTRLFPRSFVTMMSAKNIKKEK